MPMKKTCLMILLLIFLATAAFAQININTANDDELASLPGIGKVKAEAIIEHRQQYGNFETVQDLTKVKGIGNKTLTKIKADITVKSE
jgi:competence protein ComEA